MQLRLSRRQVVTSVSQSVKLLSCVRLFAIPWTVAYQAPPSMEFSRQEYWSGLPFPCPGDLPDARIEPGLPHCRQMLYRLSYQGSPGYIFRACGCHFTTIQMPEQWDRTGCSFPCMATPYMSQPDRIKFRQLSNTFKEDSKTTLGAGTPCKAEKP